MIEEISQSANETPLTSTRFRWYRGISSGSFIEYCLTSECESTTIYLSIGSSVTELPVRELSVGSCPWIYKVLGFLRRKWSFIWRHPYRITCWHCCERHIKMDKNDFTMNRGDVIVKGAASMIITNSFSNALLDLHRLYTQIPFWFMDVVLFRSWMLRRQRQEEKLVIKILLRSLPMTRLLSLPSDIFITGIRHDPAHSSNSCVSYCTSLLVRCFHPLHDALCDC